MSYDSSAYGSSTIGSSAASQWQTFFPWLFGVARPAGEYEAIAETALTSGFYSVIIQQSSEGGEQSMETRIYTSNDPDETPQLQTTQGDALYAQQVIGAARFITVRVTVFIGQFFSIIGRPGD